MTTPTAQKPVDAIVTAVSGYEPKHMAVWFNSLKATSFDGRIFVIAYDVSEELVTYMEAQGATVLTFQHDPKKRRYSYSQLAEEIEDHTDAGKLRVDIRWTWIRRILRFKDKIYDRRFFHASLLLKQHLQKSGEQIRFLAFSDTRDLVFQENPFLWIENNLSENQSIIVSAEGINHRDPWNYRNVLKTYGRHALTRVLDRPVCCAGFFAGRTRQMLDFMLALYYFDQTKRSGDQAAFNQLITFSGWENQVLRSDWLSPWTLHACTLLEPSENPGLFADPATFPKVVDGKVTTADGDPFAVVHQYDRSPDWSAHFESLFGDQ